MVFLYHLNVTIIVCLRGRKEFRGSVLQIHLFLGRVKALENPVVLDLFEGRVLFFLEHEGVHNVEDPLRPWVRRHFPVVLHLEAVLRTVNFRSFLLLFREDIVLRALIEALFVLELLVFGILEPLNLLLDFLFLPDTSLVLGLVLDATQIGVKLRPGRRFRLRLGQHHGALLHLLHLSLLGLVVEVPVEDEIVVVPHVLRLLEQPEEVTLGTHHRDVSHVLAHLLREEVVHNLRVGVRGVKIGHGLF